MGNKEINEAVAEFLGWENGWEHVEDENYEPNGMPSPHRSWAQTLKYKTDTGKIIDLPKFAESIDECLRWEVWLEIRRCTNSNQSVEILWQAFISDKPATSLCKAFLKLKGKEVG